MTKTLFDNEWEVYPIEYEKEPLYVNVVKGSRSFEIKYNVAEKLRVKKWKYVKLSYNHYTKQIKIEHASDNDGVIARLDDFAYRYLITSNFNKFFKLSHGRYTAERIDNAVILTPDN